MSKLIFGKFATSLAALSLAASCATTGAEGSAATAANEPQKPSIEDIALAERADPLTRANFWNTQYNLFPTDPDIAVSFSTALRGIGSYERAAEVANLTAVTHPKNFDVMIEVARAEQGKGNLLAAVRAYGMAAELRPNDATPFAAVGAIYDQRGDHDAAQIAYGEALLRDPNRPTTLSNFGLSLALQGELDAAEDKLRRAVDLADASAQVRQNFALILGLQGKFDEAREIARIDAPDRIADKNIEFLAELIGQDVRLKDVAEAVQPPPQVPEAAPTQAVENEVLAEPTELARQEPRRPRLRGTLSGGR